ncbi:MAG: ATP-binding cassette domain-containing protein [Mycetocola sp.]
MSAATIELTAVSRRFGSRHHGHLAVDTANLALDGTTSLGVVGESGSGKSTLSRMIVGLDEPTEGTVTYNGQDLRSVLSTRAGTKAFRANVQFVGQDTTSTFDPRRTLIDSLTFPAQKLQGLDKAAAVSAAETTLGEVGLDVALAGRKPHQVSGGQRQRFALARSLIVRPSILVCDEVVSALDVSVQGTILNLLKRYCEDHQAGLVFVSHGLPATAFVADELLVMYRGQLVERGPSDRVLEAPQHAYTQQLLEAHRGLGEGAEIDSAESSYQEGKSA